MSETIAGLSQLATLAFAVSTMLAMGMGLTLREVITPLRNARFVLMALGLNFLIVPAAAWLLATGLGLAPDIRIGIFLSEPRAVATGLFRLVNNRKRHLPDRA